MTDIYGVSVILGGVGGPSRESGHPNVPALLGLGMKLVLPAPQMCGLMATPLMNSAASARVASRLGQNRCSYFCQIGFWGVRVVSQRWYRVASWWYRVAS